MMKPTEPTPGALEREQMLDPDTGWFMRETSAAERVWWARVHRKAGTAPRGLLPEPIRDWAHAVLRVIGGTTLELVDGHWQPIPPERLTLQYKQAEIKRLSDELGERLGVGPSPGSWSALPMLPEEVRRRTVMADLRELSDAELAALEEHVDRADREGA